MNRLKLLALLTVMTMVIAACGDSSDADGADSTQASGGAAAQSDGAASQSDNGATQSDNGASQSDGEQLSVVVTTTIWGDIVSNVTGGNAAVEVLLPIGADPHDYQLSAAQAAMMQEADLVVVNGLALEEGLLDVIEGLEADGANILELADMLDPIEFGEGGHDHDDHDEDGDHGDEEGHDHGDEEGHDHGDEEGHDHGDEEGHKDEDDDHGDEEGHDGHDHGDEDPHVWMDPLRVADAVELIARELANLDSSVDWMANATAYADELRAVDAEVVSMLAAVPEDRRKLVTNHDAFGYFAERYGFEVVGTVIPGGSTLADPSSAELAELVDVLVDEDINVIFTESTEPAALAEALADEVEGVTVVELFTGSLGAAGSGGETYLDYVRTNASRITDALS
ncbi:MAG: metal ABC transporter substrate-binding protein [Acidimicrobiia bacterium]|nr:metal ABC transporter substrate-binding protein [Acidimicrobiia bacterium]